MCSAEFETDHFSWWNLDYKKTDFPGSGDPGFFDFGDAGRRYTRRHSPRTASAMPIPTGCGWASGPTWSPMPNVGRCRRVRRRAAVDRPDQRPCQQLGLTGDIYLNVLIDRNDDGDWDDAGEWAVQNAGHRHADLQGRELRHDRSRGTRAEVALRVTVTTEPIADYTGPARSRSARPRTATRPAAR